MHLDEEKVERLRHGELSAAAERSAREHLAGCSDCRRRIAEAQREEDEVFALFGELDRPVPPVDAEAIAVKAGVQAGHPGVLQWAAGFLLAAAIAGGAYAVPGSPLPAWVNAVVDWIDHRRDRPPPVPAPAQTPDARVAGVAVTPGQELVVFFTSPQAEGQARVSLTDGAEVTVRAPIGAATFTSHADRLVVDNAGSSATFEIEVPRAAPRVEIQVDGNRIFLKEGPRVTIGESSNAHGPYLLPLRPSGS